MKSISGPATKAADVTLHNTDTLAPACAALYVGNGGTLKVTLVDGGTVSFLNVPSGTVLPVAATVVFATGSTASGVIALY